MGPMQGLSFLVGENVPRNSRFPIDLNGPTPWNTDICGGNAAIPKVFHVSKFGFETLLD